MPVQAYAVGRSQRQMGMPSVSQPFATGYGSNDSFHLSPASHPRSPLLTACLLSTPRINCYRITESMGLPIFFIRRFSLYFNLRMIRMVSFEHSLQ